MDRIFTEWLIKVQNGPHIPEVVHISNKWIIPFDAINI
jgi:hypothetical protein